MPLRGWRYPPGSFDVIPHEMSSACAAAGFHSAPSALGEVGVPFHDGTGSIPSPNNRRRAPMSCRKLSEASFFSISSPAHCGGPQVACVGRNSTPAPFHRPTQSRLDIWPAVLACERFPEALPTSHIPFGTHCEGRPMRDNGFVEWTHNGGHHGRHSSMLCAPLRPIHGRR